jgi:subtilisin-like proprotein convertase family protein
VTSVVATLTRVTVAPTIIIPPANIVTNAGIPDVSLSVVAAGFPAPTYQWQRQNNSGTYVNLANSGGFAGVTTPTLVIASGSPIITVANAGSYRVVVSNVGGSVNATGTLTVVQSFAGAAVTTIPLAGGTASPYPRVSTSVPAFTGSSVKHVTVSLTLTHQEPYDVNILLTSPQLSRKVEFMAGLGPYQQEHEIVVSNVNVVTLYSYPVTNVVLTFDDAAAAPAPTLYPLYGGTFRPTVATPVVSFPGGAPGLPYGTNFTSFVGFNQTTAGGWRLYVNDVAQDIPATGADGRISAWTLILTVGP